MFVANHEALTVHIRSKMVPMNKEQRLWFLDMIKVLDLKVTFGIRERTTSINANPIDELAERALLK